MDKDMILKKAQSEKDERELTVENKAGNIAGAIMFLLLAITAFVMIIGYDKGFMPQALNTNAVGAMLIMAGCMYTLILDIYQIAVLKKMKKIGSLIGFTVIFIFALIRMIQFI